MLGMLRLMAITINDLIRIRQGIFGTMKSMLVLAALTGVLVGCGKNPRVTQRVEPVAASNDVEAILRAADNLKDRGELTTAIAMYQRAAAKTDSPDVMVSLGYALAANGAREQAAGVFGRAVSKAPHHPEALLGLGIAFLELGEVDKSIRYLDKLVKEGNSGNLNRFSALGAALDVAGQHDRALATYEAGLAIEPGNLDLKSNLALSHALNNRFDEALVVMQDVTNSLNAELSHQRNMVLILALAGKNNDAVSLGYRRLGEAETRDVLAQASTARSLTSAAERARSMVGIS